MHTDCSAGEFAAQMEEGLSHLATGVKEIQVGSCLIATALITRFTEVWVDQGGAVLVGLATRLGARAVRRHSVG